MKSRAGIIGGVGQDWEVVEIDVDAPKAGEVIVEWKAAGLCHSDEHLVTGDMVPPEEAWPLMGITNFFPMIGGHEGAGVIAEVGPGVSSVAVGDHVSASFVPACGRCRYCSTGRQNLCDQGAGAFLPGMITDGTSRHRLGDGTEVGLFAKLGTFSEFSCVAESQVIKVEPDYPLDAVALVSCGVATGWGSATKRADVAPGDTVVVVGIGGIGINAVQGAAMAGARHVIAIDPVEFKREQAQVFGATHTATSVEEAAQLVMDLTWGAMADKVIVAMGVGDGRMLESIMTLCAKGGRVVYTNIAGINETEVSLNLFNFTLLEKQLVGSIFGSANPRRDIPRLLRLYQEGKLKLDELITRTYTLEDINQGYQDMRDGKNIRGMVMY